MREFTRHLRPRMAAFFVYAAVSCAPGVPFVRAAESGTSGGTARLDVWEYYVSGNTVLDDSAIAEALAPYLGPSRSPDDVDQARAALEAAYRQRGYKTVGVAIPQQTVHDGVVRLDVVEASVGHLNVIGSKYHSIERIKEQVPSLAEGKVPDFDEVQTDIVAVNQQSDRRVTPALKAGSAPGTVDVDLVVDDDLPLHGSFELNNRKSQDTSSLRALASVSYDNLWQRGHSLNLSYQTAPENVEDARVFYGSYLARFGSSPFSLLLSGLRSDSNVSTVGGTDVVGNGTVIGVRGVWAFPATETFYSSISFGVDYKRFRNRVSLKGDSFVTPIEYYPFALGYSGVLRQGSATTQFDIGARFAMRDWGSDSEVFMLNRSYARGQQFSVRASLQQSLSLPAGFELRARLGGQITDEALISNEQFSAGGLDSVRGYLEAEVLGDQGVDASLELHGPSLFSKSGFIKQFAVYAFVDGAQLNLRDATPDQDAEVSIASSGIGLDLQLWSALHGALTWAAPFKDGPATQAWDSRALFRVWTDF
ncbi:ShlB/FhaC/HecB family hemolysin secretion/activation protein [Solimonas flava]|uniref:ShlB/FhaC/HecB family hemolysin secretion/activation protein n=1 Tax=Solimonas flava TaxID=415849 RepID=UPI000A040040|nr:ShlB/FhaC/HecB family hemolysin secretion/activation protein [Solimonas flava]